MNPAKKNGRSFFDLTGYHQSRDRRIVMGWFPKIKVPVEQTDAEEFWLDLMIQEDRCRTEKLPVPRNPGLRAAGRFRVIIDLLVRDPDVAASTDEHVLNNMARGGTAWR